MHDKFIVRDGASVWSGSGNFPSGGLLLQDNNFFPMDSPAVAAVYSKTFGDLGAPGHSASHPPGPKASAGSPPTKIKIGKIPVTIFFSTQAGATEGIETEVQNRLKGAKKIRVIAMLISDPGILKSLLALKNKNIKGVLDPHEMKVVMKKKKTDPNFWFANGDPRFVAANSHAFNGKGDTNDFMHNKEMIIHHNIVAAGHKFGPADLAVIPFFKKLLRESSGDDDLGVRWGVVAANPLKYSPVPDVDSWRKNRDLSNTPKFGIVKSGNVWLTDTEGNLISRATFYGPCWPLLKGVVDARKKTGAVDWALLANDLLAN